jgi:hypothetical protein
MGKRAVLIEKAEERREADPLDQDFNIAHYEDEQRALGGVILLLLIAV